MRIEEAEARLTAATRQGEDRDAATAADRIVMQTRIAELSALLGRYESGREADSRTIAALRDDTVDLNEEVRQLRGSSVAMSAGADGSKDAETIASLQACTCVAPVYCMTVVAAGYGLIVDACVRMFMCVLACVVCEHVRMCVCARVCMYVCMCVFACAVEVMVEGRADRIQTDSRSSSCQIDRLAVRIGYFRPD